MRGDDGGGGDFEDYGTVVADSSPCFHCDVARTDYVVDPWGDVGNDPEKIENVHTETGDWGCIVVVAVILVTDDLPAMNKMMLRLRWRVVVDSWARPARRRRAAPVRIEMRAAAPLLVPPRNAVATLWSTPAVAKCIVVWMDGCTIARKFTNSNQKSDSDKKQFQPAQQTISAGRHDVQSPTRSQMVQLQIIKIPFRQIVDRFDFVHGRHGRQRPRFIFLQLVEFRRRQ